MIRIKRLMILTIAGMAGFAACHTISNVSSNYRSESIVIDGKLDEWKEDANYDGSSELHYSVNHDKENLYVGLMVKDDMVQRKILMFGLTLWVDTTGGKDQNRGIRYPIPSEKRREVQRNPATESDLPERARRAIPNDTRTVIGPALMDKMTLLGFNDIEEETVSIAENTGIEVRIQRQKTIGLTYEAKIPADRLYADGSLVGKELSLGIITGFLELPDRSSGLLSPGGMGPGGGGMYPGRGGQMGRNPGVGGNLEELQKSTKLWLKGIEFEGEGQ